MNMIETMHLTKEYSDFAAVSDINLHIRKVTVYGFLGPNGAGKSTTMKMFLGLTRPSSGSFTIDGMSHPGDRMKILREVGSFIEAPAFYGNLTGEDIGPSQVFRLRRAGTDRTDPLQEKTC